MRILFVSDLNYLPQHRGGVQSVIHEMSLELAARGHEPMVLAPIHHQGWLGLRNRILMKLLGKPTIRDRFLGYSVYRRWHVCGQLDEPIAVSRPDAAVVMPRASVALARDLVRQGVPTVLYLQDVEFQEFGGDPRDLEGVVFASNSAFTASRFRELYGIDSVVIPPLIRASEYRTDSTRANVTLINPHPNKGVALALDIVRRCPDIPFTFVECWVLQGEDRRSLDEAVAALPNLTLRAQTGDMKSVYGQAKILLAPSRWYEAWGRVASEAHFSGIPVVASNRGGLPESVGPGGVLLDPDGPVEPWVEAIRRLWTDDDFYRAKQQAALDYAQRPQMEPRHQIAALVELAEQAIALRPAKA